MDIAALKMEHHKLCEVVESADNMFSPLLLGIVSLYIPLLCFSFYNVVINNLREKGKLVIFVNNFAFILVSVGNLAVIMLFGSKVNEKV